MEIKINIEGSITKTSKTYKCIVNYLTTPPRITIFLFMSLLFYSKSHAYGIKFRNINKNREDEAELVNYFIKSSILFNFM